MNKGEETAIGAALEKILSRLEEMNVEILDGLQKLDQTLEDLISRNSTTPHTYDTISSDYPD